MTDTKLILIAGRSLKQGTGLNMGKGSDDYQEATTTLQMNQEDMTRFGVADGDQVKVKTATGETIVQCQGTDIPEGMVFIAYGPASSQLMDRETHGTGMPDSKGFEVEVERVD